MVATIFGRLAKTCRHPCPLQAQHGLARIEPGKFAVGLQTGDRISASLVTADSAFWPMLDGLSLATFAGDTVRYHLLKAETDAFRRNPSAERAHGDSARVLIERRLKLMPNDAKILATLALAHMHLGRHADAIRSGERPMTVSGMPKFVVGSREIVFVQKNGVQFCPLVALMHGRYRVLKDESTAREHIARDNGLPLTDAAEVQQPMQYLPDSVRAASAATDRERALTPEAFETSITAEVKRNAPAPRTN